MKRWFCSDCGKAFFRQLDETWKTRCVSCFVRHKNARVEIGPDYRALWEQADAECYRLRTRVSALERQLAHTDRHNNSTAATVATQWLLDVKRRLNS